MLVALWLAVVAFGFQQTAIVPAIPVIEGDLHASRTWSVWLLSGYLAASAAFTPLVGKLGDRWGKKRMLLWSLVVFLVGAGGAALAPNLVVLVVFRAVQGVGGAVFPLTLAILPEQLRWERVPRGSSMLTSGFGLGTALGFGCSGLLVAAGSWRWIFAAGAAMILVAIAVVGVLVAPMAPRDRVALDFPGMGLLTGGLVLLLVALTEGEPRGWASPWVLGSFAVSALLLMAWIGYDLRAREPLLDLRELARRRVLLTHLATVALGVVLFGVFSLVPYLLRAPFGPDAAPHASGLYLLPVAAGQLLCGMFADRIARRATARWTYAAGLVLAALGALGLALEHGSAVAVLVAALLTGAGAGLGIAVASAIVSREAAGTHTGVATALNSVLRRIGGGVGAQVSAALLASPALVGQRGFTAAFLICAFVAAVGAVLAAGTGRPERA